DSRSPRGGTPHTASGRSPSPARAPVAGMGIGRHGWSRRQSKQTLHFARQQNQPPFLQTARWPCPVRPSRRPSKPSVRSDHSSPITCLRPLIPQFSECHQNQKNEGIPELEHQENSILI